MSKVTEAMSQVGGSVVHFAIWIVIAYACIHLSVHSLSLVRDLSRQAKSGLVSLLAVVAFGGIGYLTSTNIWLRKE